MALGTLQSAASSDPLQLQLNGRKRDQANEHTSPPPHDLGLPSVPWTHRLSLPVWGLPILEHTCQVESLSPWVLWVLRPCWLSVLPGSDEGKELEEL